MNGFTPVLIILNVGVLAGMMNLGCDVALTVCYKMIKSNDCKG